MALNWIATRTQDASQFNPAGLGSLHLSTRVGGELLPRGSILIETVARPAEHPINLVRFAALDPWPSSLTICLEPDGTLRLMVRQGARHLETAVKTSLGRKVFTAQIAYIWDAPKRRGRLSVYVPDYGHLWQADVLSPFPLALRDAQRMAGTNSGCALDPDVVFLAIADAPCPVGPTPGLSGDAAVDTPDGPRPIRDIKPGDKVNTVGHGAVPVLWAGCSKLPSLGRFAPMTLRRPYIGLWDDLNLARDQRICLAGSEVEYMFGEEFVSTAVRHLEIRNCASPAKVRPPIATYHQILLETHEIIRVNGALLESFDGSAVLEMPSALATSVLADLRPDLRPRALGLAAPVLQGYEALTLTGVTIG